MKRRRRSQICGDTQAASQADKPEMGSSNNNSHSKLYLILNECNVRLTISTQIILLITLASLIAPVRTAPPTSAIHFEPESNSYSGLTFSFDPRLDKRVEWLHFEHWLSIMQHSSGLLYEALNGRAHLAEVRVLIPYKWRQFEWPVLHKPGVPIIMNRRVLYADSDVIVGFEDPVYKETPFAVQHDECARQGLNIRMPISFLEQNKPLDPKLKARQLVREFASHRYGIFKESGFRNDPMYPPFASLAGLGYATPRNRSTAACPAYLSYLATPLCTNHSDSGDSPSIRGFDENWNECSFETSPGSGTPLPSAMNCAPYLSKRDSQVPAAGSGTPTQAASLNLMSLDPFSYLDFKQSGSVAPKASHQPVEWRELADSAKWHFCGENFPASGSSELSGRPKGSTNLAHNQLAANKQNVMCNERSALDVIKSSEDFKRNSISPSTFNRLPATNFKFMQEMPPRIILCIEYAAHLYQSRRLDHGILEAAITKFLAFDLIADTEVALVLFGQQHSTRNPFKKLDSSVDARLTIFSPPIDPFDEAAKLYSEQELSQLDIQASNSQSAKLIKGTCSFAKVMAEANALQQQRSQYDDVGADIIMLTSGLFVEDESKIEEIIKQTYRSDNLQLNLIIYPSTMLFDTKSRDGFIVLDAIESDTIVRARLAKLHLIQRLTNAKIHLVREHLDSNGDVKMSTLVQFYQIFDHISKGHSWDQTHSMISLSQQTVEARASGELQQQQQNKLHFQFEVDSSLAQAELVVGFIDPKHRSQQRSGKRFKIRNLQLRSPGGHLVLSDTPSSQHPVGGPHHELASLQEKALNDEPGREAEQELELSPTSESALFPYRTQLSLAGFHLKPAHFAQLNNSRFAGTWTLTATSDEPIQTNGVAMAQVDPAGDTVTANCWIQTYYQEVGGASAEFANQPQPQQLRQVKVFMQSKGPAHMGPAQEVQARMEVQDELGNIVQNVNMLDDGLGAPDMTRGDGIHSQYVQRAHRPGYYKVSVEMSGANDGHHKQGYQASSNKPAVKGNQDNACCGSFVPQSPKQIDTRHLSRQLYCGTFYVDSNNKLAQQRPPRVNNLTIVNVDQENRRVTIRWFEPSLDITAVNQQTSNNNKPSLDSNELLGVREEVAAPPGEQMALQSDKSSKRVTRGRPPIISSEESEEVEMMFDTQNNQRNNARGLIMSSQPQVLSNRYEIKLFSDRDAIKRSFDAKHEVGFRFNEWNVEGTFPNASNYGGLKEVSLRIPYGREGIYYIALKVYNNLGLGSQMSNIVEFWIKNNLTLEEAESIYGQATTVDAAGNVYDINGVLIQRAGQLNYSILSNLDGISVLVFISIIAFVFSILCIALVTCLVSSARRSFGRKRRHSKAEDKKSVAASSLAIAGAGSGSSMVSSGCSESSQRSEMASSSSGSQGGHDVEINKLSLVGHVDDGLHSSANQTTYQKNQAEQLMYQQPHHFQQDIYQHFPQSNNKQLDNNNHWLQHTMVNGYAYATVNGLAPTSPAADLNQNQLGAPNITNPVQSWPADILLSHYDKVKKARERNEAPPVMRIETLDQGQFSDAGLPIINDEQQQIADQSYLVRQQSNQMSSYFNQQLQQQLSSVLKSKQRHSEDENNTSPALEGLTDHLIESAHFMEQHQQQMAPPPPQYIYCSSQESGLQPPTMISEPSIYSQVTNLQQVDANGYYANNQQWQQQQQLPNSCDNQQSPIYAAHHHQHQFQAPVPADYSQQQQQPLEASNSAISEV